MGSEEFRHLLVQALKLDFPYSERPPLTSGTRAAVLFLIGFDKEGPSLLMTRRTETVESHKGQMAFPGGHSEPEETESEEGSERTALRETHEEVGIPPQKVRIHGHLPGLWTPSGFWITPVVGTLEGSVGEIALQPDPREIAEAFWIPLSTLKAPGTYTREFKRVGPINYPIHVYQVGPHRIWGATGAMIKNLLDRLDRARALG